MDAPEDVKKKKAEEEEEEEDEERYPPCISFLFSPCTLALTGSCAVSRATRSWAGSSRRKCARVF